MFLWENEMPHQMFYSYDTHQIWTDTTFENNLKKSKHGLYASGKTLVVGLLEIGLVLGSHGPLFH
jgi:hypothetical protein